MIAVVTDKQRRETNRELSPEDFLRQSLGKEIEVEGVKRDISLRAYLVRYKEN
jgi:hypothetical protein